MNSLQSLVRSSHFGVRRPFVRNVASGVLMLASVGLVAPIFQPASLGVTALAQGRSRGAVVPTGTVIKLQMDRTITSKEAKVGDTFTTTIFEPVLVDGQEILSTGMQVQGRVTTVSRAQSRGRSGTIGVEFDRLLLPNNRSVTLKGFLTSLDPEEKKQIDNEGRVSGGSSTKKNTIFIGGGAGVGAAIGAIAGGGKGAGIGAGVGAGAGVLGALLTKGKEAEVQSGQKFGLELSQSLSLANAVRDSRDDDRDNSGGGGGSSFAYDEERGEFTSPELIRQAQDELRDRKVYFGPTTGNIGPATRRALRTFQTRQGLKVTARLDRPTAEALGLLGRSETDAPNGGFGFDEQAGEFTDAEVIRRAQSKLRRQNFYSGPLTGSLTDETRVALGRYQRSFRLTETERLDRKTAESLGVLD
jgi:hypothetical protein